MTRVAPPPGRAKLLSFCPEMAVVRPGVASTAAFSGVSPAAVRLSLRGPRRASAPDGGGSPWAKLLRFRRDLAAEPVPPASVAEVSGVSRARAPAPRRTDPARPKSHPRTTESR
jgi:hypothetical protein